MGLSAWKKYINRTTNIAILRGRRSGVPAFFIRSFLSNRKTTVEAFHAHKTKPNSA
jgi:hypothetical protein